ncbi:NAD(P)/FAD-dependent oxidoreductase [Pelagovum pacificum]|uniref:FAD-binding oxidoreductase n=1 Tax=Pelagovum pacificum TaxID=2588711 RepID=A0A5C5G9B8_9RHOB|nr:FAD-binding oxidoreductase [Pelagovum pacificum]QQA41967.1 FAD-binding oxidoreductase [Pelagovum pacificum]TNY30592.1 FAD-binding oxidoreductase [Pelagovum pacificum]
MTQHDVIVLGAGVIGGFIAWNLAQQGAAVAVADPAGPAARPSASWASAGGLRSQGRHDADRPVTLRASELWATMSDRLGAELEISFGGHLHLAETEDQVPDIEARIAADSSKNIAIERLNGRQIAEIAPILAPGMAAGAFTPGDGQAHPGRVAEALSRALGELGVERHFGQLASLVTEGERVVGVDIKGGPALRAPVTVVACGAWSAKLIEPLGLQLPVRARGLQMVLSDIDSAGRLAPTVTAVGRNLSLKQVRSGAYMLGGRWFGRPTGRGLETEPLDAHVAAQWAGAAALLPRLSRHRIAHAWAGTEAQSIDGNPFIGRHGPPGLYLAFGFSNHGFQISPAIGELIAGDITGDRDEPLLAPFSPARPGPGPAAVSTFQNESILQTA